MKNIVVVCLLLFSTFSLKAQFNHIIDAGTVTYEYKINQYERSKKLLGQESLADKYRDYLYSLEQNRFVLREYKLSFDHNISFFQLMNNKEITNYLDFLLGIPTTSVYRDLNADSLRITKESGEDIYNLKDVIVPIKWKFTTERMNILGYECRRANAIILDSIYVVAFYCPDINVPSGPSIFGGLPGLILGVSLPYDNINIFATEVRLDNPEIPKTSLKKENNKTMTFNEYGDFIKNLSSSKSRIDYNQRSLYF
ncbi:GLPGLI family protein [Albibacterium bauzanense]|uniref:GLPGLI family protein n=1 Tax=Albibacterium bauzanense TaxID=653929 RepID=A0A4R1M1L8_9SPHI|nr:GLPGLI family protein [Albibacterium bauzanense]TCK85092.1 GLPGLI family protein [Albibacterium bauzanense]